MRAQVGIVDAGLLEQNTVEIAQQVDGLPAEPDF
jgi:hypothetical protein